MIIKRKIRQEVSQIVDVLIPENRWESYIDLMDRDNKFGKRNLISIIMVMCQEIEAFEGLIEDLYFQLDQLQGSKLDPTPSTEQFKLRTALDIKLDLDKTFDSDTKAFYVSNKDWEILTKGIDPEMAKTKPEYGYGKEIDPKDGKEKTCMYFHALPIFKNLK